MFYRSGTACMKWVKQCHAPADAVCYFHSPGYNICLHELTLQQLSAVGKLWHQIENPTPSIDAYSLQQCCGKISSQSPISNHEVLGFFAKMTSWPPSWKYEVICEIRLHQSMQIHSRNIPAKFHPHRIWNDGALSFFESGHPKKKNKKMMRVVILDQVPYLKSQPANSAKLHWSMSSTAEQKHLAIHVQ